MSSASRAAIGLMALLAALNLAPAAAAADAAAAGKPAAAAFATVGDTVVSAADYQRALAVAMRKKYYHAKPPEGEYAKFQREVGDDVVNRVLLLAEAKRRGIQPDRAMIDATVAGYDKQYGGSANWKANRDKMLAAVVPQLESDSLLERLGKLVKAVPEPSEAVARAYYDKHKDLFVEPEQVKLSVILLKVDPSSPQAVWNGALEEARGIHRKLKAGADFAETGQAAFGRQVGGAGRPDGLHPPRHAARGGARRGRQAQGRASSPSRCSCSRAWPSCAWTIAARPSSAPSTR